MAAGLTRMARRGAICHTREPFSPEMRWDTVFQTVTPQGKLSGHHATSLNIGLTETQLAKQPGSGTPSFLWV